jgi:hypothetical protein
MGWIKIDRKIFDHWVFADSWKFKAWIDLIGMANHTPAKVEISGQIVTIDRGQFFRSIDSLANRWSTNKSKVYRFLKLLEKDNMIALNNETKVTIITICNYVDYQDDSISDETKSKRRRNAGETQTKLSKNNKELKKEELRAQIAPFLQDFGRDLCNEFYLYWTEITKDGSLRFEKEKAFSVERRLNTWKKNQAKFDTSGEDLYNNVMKQIK